MAKPSSSGRKALFLEEAAFAFDFTDNAPAEDADAPTELTKATEYLAPKTGAATLADVEAALSSVEGAGLIFLKGKRDEWPAQRQRHRDCVTRALRRAEKARALRHAGKKRAKGARDDEHSNSD